MPLVPVADVLAAAGSEVADDEAASLAVPLIAAANAVTCVRTAVSCVRVASSSVALTLRGAVPVVAEPLVPVGLPAASAGPIMVVRILSIAATSVPQLALPFAAVALGLAGLLLPAARSSALRWRFSSASCVLFFPVTAVGAMLARALLACCRCSCAAAFCAESDWAPAVADGCCVVVAGGCAVAGVCAMPETGRPSSAAAASKVVHRAVERFIGGSS